MAEQQRQGTKQATHSENNAPSGEGTNTVSASLEEKYPALLLHYHDLKKIAHSEAAYEKMISFCELKHFPYMVINTDTLTPEEIVNRIIEVFNNGIL